MVAGSPGLLFLKDIVTDHVELGKIIKIIENKERITIIDNICINRFSESLWIYPLSDEWRISILNKTQVLTLIDQLNNLAGSAYILTFDGTDFKVSKYSQEYLDNLNNLYLDQDIYIGMSTGISQGDFIYSYNQPGLCAVIGVILKYACVIPVMSQPIEDAVSQKNSQKRFAFDDQSAIKIIGPNRLRVFSFDYENMYDINTDAFLGLVNIYNDHDHGLRKAYCSKIVLISDSSIAQLALVDY